MRDLLLAAIILSACVVSLRRPWIGVLLWTWLSILNPHRYTYGFAFNAPWAALAAGCTLLGFLATRDRHNPFIDKSVFWFAALCAWMTFSWLVGLDVDGDYPQWSKVIKINMMILVALALIRSKYQILGLVVILVISLALIGVKGGIFTILHGGSERVWGPPGSFIEDNNECALALIMVIPLVRFLQIQLSDLWAKRALGVGMALIAVSALGSQSRGGFIAIMAMGLFLWAKSRNKGRMAVLILVVGSSLVAFMPDTWTERMNTIETYEADASAQGRITAWKHAWNVAGSRVAGAGFDPSHNSVVARYSPEFGSVRAAHSIYFQIMGNHGHIGLFMFIMIWVATWRTAGTIIRDAKAIPEASWCGELAAMVQVSLIAYLVGGAFLSLAYFDLPYNLMVLIAVTRVWLTQKAWLTEPDKAPRWLSMLGKSSVSKAGAVTSK